MVDIQFAPALAQPDVTQRFDAIPESVTATRRWVREELERHGVAHRRRIVELLATELASNVVIHVGAPFEVGVTFDGSVIRVAVRDPSPEMPRETNADSDATAGRGFTLVRRLSRRCGVDASDRGKVVWFEVDAFRQFAQPHFQPSRNADSAS